MYIRVCIVILQPIQEYWKQLIYMTDERQAQYLSFITAKSGPPPLNLTTYQVG